MVEHQRPRQIDLWRQFMSGYRTIPRLRKKEKFQDKKKIAIIPKAKKNNLKVKIGFSELFIIYILDKNYRMNCFVRMEETAR